MLDVATVSGNGEDDADLAIFVDRLAAAGSDRSTSVAQAQIRRSISAGASPPGLRRLAEALAASVAELPPPPRRPSEDIGSVVSAMRGTALVILEDFDARAVAGSVAALLADGRRVMVTATTAPELAAVRSALPRDVAGRALDRLPALAATELRELRRLLATSTPHRRARIGQQLPLADALPAPADVAALCRQAVRPAGATAGAWMIPSLLADLDAARRDAVTSVARCVGRSLGALHPRAEREWAWRLLSELIHSRHRATFDRMLEDTAQAIAALNRARTTPQVSFVGAPQTGAVDILRRYRDFLDAGGRTRGLFRPSIQREVQTVLSRARLGSRVAESEDDVVRIIEHLELGERLDRVDAGCAEIGIAAAANEAELVELAAGLLKVAAAARSVGALRHDVLFIAADSPLSVPDLESAEQIATAILEYADHGSAAEAAARLDSLAWELDCRTPVIAMAPEHEQAVAALRHRDMAGYVGALDALGAARREVRDEIRCAELLRKLGESAPQLADAWTALGTDHPSGLGLASFAPMESLLGALPAPDSADVVVVLGAAGLGVERLLLAAVAPRMIAAVGPGEHQDGAPTLLSVLRRASALVIRGRAAAAGRVVPITSGAARGAPAPVGQAGA